MCIWCGKLPPGKRRREPIQLEFSFPLRRSKLKLTDISQLTPTSTSYWTAVPSSTGQIMTYGWGGGGGNNSYFTLYRGRRGTGT